MSSKRGRDQTQTSEHLGYPAVLLLQAQAGVNALQYRLYLQPLVLPQKANVTLHRLGVFLAA